MKQAKLFGDDYKPEPKVLKKLDLVNAEALALRIQGAIASLCDKIQIVGSIRRKKTMVGDIDFVITATDANCSKIIQVLNKPQAICSGPIVIKLNYPYDGKVFQVDFYRAYDNNFGIQQLIRTGSADHNMWLASYALSKGFRLKYSEGLLKDGRVIVGITEEDVFSALGLPCPKPGEREIVDGKPVWLKT
jgi:DNA polymerase/3'-5' exonuclease PolX